MAPAVVRCKIGSLRRCVIAQNLTATIPDRAQQLADARQFAIAAARAVADMRCHSVRVLDVSKLNTVTDFLVLATGTSPRQMQSVGDDLDEVGRETGFELIRASGRGGESWAAFDFVDVVAHVFSEEARLFYDLDSLWGDGDEVEWRAE